MVWTMPMVSFSYRGSRKSRVDILIHWERKNGSLQSDVRIRHSLLVNNYL